ncbi:MAG: hypothetical protein AAF899_07105 [Pseudomonadota bacterium]
MDPDKTALRRGDFWTALFLIALSIFFLARTATLPWVDVSSAGVEGDWYNSAALVPFLIFGALLVLAVGLMVVAVRDGGLPEGLRRVIAGRAFGGRGVWSLPRPALTAGSQRIVMVSVILLAYIVALVPRVDFVVSSALVITALILGFHASRPRAAAIAAAAVVLPAAYAMVANFPSSAWQAPHDDDWVTLACFALLVVVGLVEAKLAEGRIDRARLSAPVMALVVPFLLVCAMAFGFRQNVPNSGGLIFTQVQYHYYVTLRPLWQGS